MKREARLVFDAGRDGVWTIRFRAGKVDLVRGRAGRASGTISADRETLIAVLEGRRAGVEAFLAGKLIVRGNLALPLELDDLLHPAERDPRAPTCHRVDVGGVETFYLEAGPRDAPPIVLFHGLGATSASFLPTLWDLARDHHVFAVDLPGFGESGKPVRPLHPAYFATWGVGFLDAVGLPCAHLVGNSMGGRVALEIALQYPARVKKVALLTPSLAWRRYRAFVRLVRWLRPEIAVLPLPALHAMVMGVLRALFAHPERIPAPAMEGAADEFLRVFATPRGRIAFFHAAREIYLEDPHGRRGFWDRLPSLSRPALFLFGDRDVLVPASFARHVRKAVPHAQVEILRECGHVPQFEVPEETNERVRAFFRE
jgi:pimeloyl-ACP methyl ester carboxylesterase